MKKILLYFLLIFLNFVPFVQAETIVLPSQSAYVENVKYVDVENEDIDIVKQAVTVKIKSGIFKGETLELDNVLTGNPYYDISLKKRMKVVLHAEDNGKGIEYSIADVQRSNTLVYLSLLFCGLLIYVGKKKGINSLVSIVLTVILIAYALSPMILMGVNPIIATVLVCVMSTLITMYLVGGLNAKSSAASLGAILSLIFAGVLSLIAIKTASLTGFTGENSMFLYSAHPQLDFISITISAIALSTLGAVMDVAMSIASTINEILVIDSQKSIKELFTSGMNVGRDIIGTMANTLILVYLGGSLPLLLLASNIDLYKFINLNQVVTEISAALIGSIAIIICVPITAIIASKLLRKTQDKLEQNKIDLDCV